MKNILKTFTYAFMKNKLRKVRPTQKHFSKKVLNICQKQDVNAFQNKGLFVKLKYSRSIFCIFIFLNFIQSTLFLIIFNIYIIILSNNHKKKPLKKKYICYKKKTIFSKIILTKLLSVKNIIKCVLECEKQLQTYSYF